MRMLSQNQLSFFNDKLNSFLIDIGVGCGPLIDLTDNIITNLVDGKNQADIYSLAALATGNSGADNTMAKILDKMDFSLLFYKGKSVNIHFKLFPRISNLYFRKRNIAGIFKALVCRSSSTNIKFAKIMCRIKK